MSDLQCPARILLLREPPGERLARRLEDERVAATYAAPVDLDELADRHRGETVVVVGEHTAGRAPVVLLEIDADGRRATEWDDGGAEVRQP